MNTYRSFVAALGMTLLAFTLITLTGCNQSSRIEAEKLKEYQTSFTLGDEPDGAKTVIEIREQLTGEKHAEHDHDEHAHHDEDAAADDPGNDDPGNDDHAHDEHAHEHGDGDHDHDHSADLADDADEQEIAAKDADHEHEHDGDDHEGDDHDDDAEDHAEGHDAHAGHDHDEAAHDDHAGHDHAGHVHEAIDVVMVGVVGGIANPATATQPEFPFVKDYAIVTLVDPEAATGGHEHADGEHCSFCEAHAGDKAVLLATVQFMGQNGKVLSVDARELFDLKEKDTVVVRGKAWIEPDGTLLVDAAGIYVRR